MSVIIRPTVITIIIIIKHQYCINMMLLSLTVLTPDFIYFSCCTLLSRVILDVTRSVCRHTRGTWSQVRRRWLAARLERTAPAGVTHLTAQFRRQRTSQWPHRRELLKSASQTTPSTIGSSLHRHHHHHHHRKICSAPITRGPQVHYSVNKRTEIGLGELN